MTFFAGAFFGLIVGLFVNSNYKNPIKRAIASVTSTEKHKAFVPNKESDNEFWN